MIQLNNRINLDRAKCAGDNASKGEKTMRNSSNKTPWHLRFAPSCLRKKAIIAIVAVVALLTPISAMALHPVVVFLTGWAAGQTLTAAKQALINRYLNAKMATASVNGAYWGFNFHKFERTLANGTVLRSDLAVQWDELDGTPRGWHYWQSYGRRTMDEETASYYLTNQEISRIVIASGCAENDNGDTAWAVGIKAREDSFEEVASQALDRIRREEKDSTYEWKDDLWVKTKWTSRVGSHKMKSDFNDPNVPKIPQLGDKGPRETQTYTGTVYWDKVDIDMYGRSRNREEKDLDVSFEAYRDNQRWRKLCHNNQAIDSPHITASITRKIEQRSKLIHGRIPGILGTYRMGWSRTNWLVVVHID